MKNIFENASAGKVIDFDVIIPVVSGPGPDPVWP